MVGRGFLAWIVCCSLPAQTVYTYVGNITPHSALIAWGTATGSVWRNTIGRDSAPLGPALLRIGGRQINVNRNWAEVEGLKPDTQYPYEVDINGKRAGGGEVRTWPERAGKLAFFVIGDYGTGGAGQRAIAADMWREFERLAASDNPVRFALTVGDNIYASVHVGPVALQSGHADSDWARKFFEPYRDLIRRIPFYPTLGNHDGNATENRADLFVYLDNFFFPDGRPERWYEFSYGGLADFFALDTTDNTSEGPPAPAYRADGPQTKWLADALRTSRAPWKIPYFHHPPFTAGPGHGSSYSALRAWLELFEKYGVQAVFSGHEHNFQASEDDAATGGIRYFISGAGGELRKGNVMARMAQAHMEGWAAERHFLLVEIEGSLMRVTPMADGPIVVKQADGTKMPLPIVVRR